MKDETILLAHGSGGSRSRELIRDIAKIFSNSFLDPLDDSAVCGDFLGRLAFTCDAYVVSPLVFPGGDIGKLAVCGTVNDLAMSGARPLYLSLSLIVEEGFPTSDLERLLHSASEAAASARTLIVTGDTKVVNRGSADGLFMATSGVGVIPEGRDVRGAGARAGDKVILSGTVGDHGVAILSTREGLSFSTGLLSDCAPLNGLVEAMFASSSEIHCMRDPTRGGLATTLVELATQSGVEVLVDETRIPVREEVRGACEMLGLDPLYVANEGKLVAIVAAQAAEEILRAMRSHPLGRDAEIIGEVAGSGKARALLRTQVGGTRILNLLSGEQLPRIC